MKATISGNKLVIEIDINTKPEPSSTGKTLVIASTHGNQKAGIQIGGQDLIIGLNAYIKR